MTKRVSKTDNRDARLRGWVERVGQLDTEIKALNADKADVYREAKEAGEDPNAVRAAVAFLRDPEKVMQKNAATVAVLERLGWDGKAFSGAQLAGPPPAIEGPTEPVDTDASHAHAHVHVHAHEGDTA